MINNELALNNITAHVNGSYSSDLGVPLHFIRVWLLLSIIHLIVSIDGCQRISNPYV